MDTKYTNFILSIIMHAAKQWDISMSDVYKKMSQTDIIEGYFIPYYGVLHSLGMDYLVSDTKKYLIKSKVW